MGRKITSSRFGVNATDDELVNLTSGNAPVDATKVIQDGVITRSSNSVSRIRAHAYEDRAHVKCGRMYACRHVGRLGSMWVER